MKRNICLLLVFLFFLTTSMIVYAVETTTYRLDDLGLSVDVPVNLIVFTRDIKSNDPHLTEFGLTKEGMETLMEDGNIYLNAWDKNGNYEVIITMTENSLNNFSLLSDTFLETLATSLSDVYKEAGISLIKTEIYQHQQAKFIKIFISRPNNGSTVYGLQYYTVYDGKAINITLQSYSGDINVEKETILKTMVDSVVFDSDLVQSNTPKYTQSFLYTDKNTGVIFTVPENWSQVAFSKDRDFLSAKFSSNIEEGLTIFFGGHDLWNELPASDKQGMTRADINNSAFSKSDIGDMLGIQAQDISTVTYGGKEYYMGKVTTTQSEYGINITVTMTYLFYFDNGYVFNFQTNISNGSSYYRDFEDLLSSVQYPAVESLQKSTEETTISSNQSPVSFLNSWFGIFCINMLITIIIHPTPIWIYRYAIRKKPVAPKQAKRIVIIDAIVVVALMLVVTAINKGSEISLVAVLIWSRICYSSLTKGFIENVDAFPKEATKQAVSSIISQSPQIPLTLQDDVKPDENYEKTNDKGTSQPYGAIYCRNCGAEINSDSIFCHKCGTKLK